MSNPIHHSVLENFVASFVTFGSLLGVWLFLYLTRRGFRPTSGELPPYPIILKPYPAVIILLYSIVIAWIALGATLIWIRPGATVFVLLMLIIPIASWFGVNQLAQSRIVIESTKLIYKTNKNQKEMKAEDILSCYVNRKSGELIIMSETQNIKPMKIPLLYQNMCFLYDALVDWKKL